MSKTVTRIDRALWYAAMQGVRPLSRDAHPPAPPPSPAPAAAQAPAPPRDAPPASLATPAVSTLDRPAGIDRANAERLKRGRHPIEARLDLHGMTQAEAHAALVAFVDRSYAAGRRCVLIITGRGLGTERGGILRRAVPRWLEDAALRRRILAISAAQPQHGGGGALYLLLRRARPAAS